MAISIPTSKKGRGFGRVMDDDRAKAIAARVIDGAENFDDMPCITKSPNRKTRDSGKRYANYMTATTLKGFFEKSGTRGDLIYNLAVGFTTLDPDLMASDNPADWKPKPKTAPKA